jgi:hypothetical protein
LQAALLFDEAVEECRSFDADDAAENSVQQAHATLPSGDPGIVWLEFSANIRPMTDFAAELASLDVHWQG